MRPWRSSTIWGSGRSKSMLPRFARFARRTAMSSSMSPNSVQERGVAFPLGRVPVHEDLAHRGIGHALVAVDDALVDVVPQDLSFRRDVHLAGEGEPVHVRVQAADAVRKRFGEHGNGAVGQIHAGGALVGLLVEGRAFLDIAAKHRRCAPRGGSRILIFSMEIASSKSRAVSPSMVTVGRSRRSFLPLRMAALTCCGMSSASRSVAGVKWTGSSYCSMISSESMPGWPGLPMTLTILPSGGLPRMG